MCTVDGDAGHARAAELLLHYGADPLAMNKVGQLMHVTLCGHKCILAREDWGPLFPHNSSDHAGFPSRQSNLDCSSCTEIYRL